MLVRIALHQTRLRMPGLGLDARGVALGSRGLVLLPSLDRLVAFLSLLTQSMSLADMLPALRVEELSSKLGTREVCVSFVADSSDRMDRVAEVARLSGGYTFTGSSRHFVQYRDARAPFGYDPAELLSDDGSHLLYHSSFSQAYSVVREISLGPLMLRLSVALVPQEPPPLTEALWVVAERGLGPALIGYFIRSNVKASVGLGEWPPASSFEDEPVWRYVFQVDSLPPRMLPLMRDTPGLALMRQVAPGVLVQFGYRHPVHLAACPVFPADGLVMFFGGSEPLVLERLPALGSVTAFARIQIGEGQGQRTTELLSAPLDPLSVQVRMVPSLVPYAGVTATLVPPEQLQLLRRLAYALGPETLRRASIAVTEVGAFVRLSSGIEAIPLGDFYRELTGGLFVAAGYMPLPNVSPSVLRSSIDAPSDHVVLLGRDGQVRSIDGAAFVSLEDALLEAQQWAPLGTRAIELALRAEVPEVRLDSVGMLPLRSLDERIDDENR